MNGSASRATSRPSASRITRADQLGDVVFVDLPKVGRVVKKAEAAAVVESVKAASDVYAPISGEVVAVNEALGADPSLVIPMPPAAPGYSKSASATRAN